MYVHVYDGHTCIVCMCMLECGHKAPVNATTSHRKVSPGAAVRPYKAHSRYLGAPETVPPCMCMRICMCVSA